LVRLFSELGLDTGWSAEEAERKLQAWEDEPLEWPIHIKSDGTKQPYIIKQPILASWLNEASDYWKWKLDHVFVCLRDWKEVAAHVTDIEQNRTLYDVFGLFEKHKFMKEEKLSREEMMEFFQMKAAAEVGKLMVQLAERETPYTLLMFPRTVTDPVYLYNKLIPVLPMGFGEFMEAFNKVADKKKVHYGKLKEEQDGSSGKDGQSDPV